MRGFLERRGGKWYVTVSDTMLCEPVRYFTPWEITATCPAPGNYNPAPQLSEGAEVEYLRNGRFQLYANGAYTWIDSTEKGERRTEPIPEPKVRKGVQTRYRNGGWQKYHKRDGWIRA